MATVLALLPLLAAAPAARIVAVTSEMARAGSIDVERLGGVWYAKTTSFVNQVRRLNGLVCHNYVHTNTHTHMYMCMYMYVCVCLY